MCSLYCLNLTQEQSTHIEHLIDSFQGEAPETHQWLSPFVLRYKALPMYLGWFETTGLLANGQVVKWSTEQEYEGVKPVDDLILFRASLMEAVNRYAGCEFLIPERPENAIDCDICEGTGTIQHPEMSKVICQCGGVGWLDTKMRPIRYKKEDCTGGPRIGGTVPEGLEEHIIDEHSQYFGTFPLPRGTEREFSIFHRFDILGNDEDRDIIAHNNKVLEPSDLIWAVVHQRSCRGKLSNQPFQACGLEIGTEIADSVIDKEGNETLYTESKLGGRCFLERHFLQNDVMELEEKGYQQLLQIGMHGSHLIEGFPWDPGFLHVWAANPDDPMTYRFMIEQ